MLRSDLEKKLTEADEALRRDIRSMEVQRQEEQDAEASGQWTDHRTCLRFASPCER